MMVARHIKAREEEEHGSHEDNHSPLQRVSLLFHCHLVSIYLELMILFKFFLFFAGCFDLMDILRISSISLAFLGFRV